MSLKAFHLVFLASAIGLTILVGGWALWRSPGGSQGLLLAILCWAVAGLLAAYTAWFLRKLRHVSYL